MNALENEKYYTYADYLKWEGDERFELIDGIPYLMSPAPSTTHQQISAEIFNQLFNFLKGKPCQVFSAPFDVRLNAADYDDTVVQPDILVICDKSKLDERGCKGAPDLIIEILSPSSAKHDRITKFKKYLKAGVREYWIADPSDKNITTYFLEHGKYVANVYNETETAPVQVLEGCQINLEEVFFRE